MRSESQHDESARRRYCFGEFTLDVDNGFLRRGEAEIPLRPKPFAVLAWLVTHHGMLVSKDELTNAVWPDAAVTDNSLAQCLFEIRRALGDDSQQLIRTVARRGYMFTAPITTATYQLSVENNSAPARNSAQRAARKLFSHKMLVTAAVAIVVIPAAIFGVSALRSPSQIVSLAVLPLENLTGEAEQYFVDGMTEALITELSKIGSIKLISRRTSSRYKGSKKPFEAIARELNVDALVSGSVTREGGRVRVNAQLIEPATGTNLWADSFERNLASVLALQAVVARAIAGSVKARVRPDDLPPEHRRKVNPATYETYLRGMFWLDQRTTDSLKKGLAYLHEAAGSDPTDPLPYAGMALGYLAVAHGPDPPGDTISRARAAAERAAGLDDSLAEAHLALAMIEGYRDWNWQSAERRLRRAIEINPNLAAAYFHKSWFSVFFGRKAEAVAAAKRAAELDPLTLDYAMAGDILRMAGRYDEAIAEARRALAINPRFPLARVILGNIYADQRKFGLALEEYAKASQVAPAMKWAAAPAYVASGRHEQARKLLADLEQLPVTPWHAYWRATLAAVLGNREEAFRWLAYEPHHDWVPYARVGDEFRHLRADPRFAALVKRMNLPPV